MQQQEAGSRVNNSDKVEIQIRETLQQWEDAFRKGDIKRILTLYADDVIAFDMVPPLQFDGKANYKKSWQQAAKISEAPWVYEAHNRHVEIGGHIAFAFCLAKCGGMMNGKVETGWVRHTQCFRKIGDRWLIVHEALSVPADLKTGKALMDLTPDELKH